MTLLQEEEEEVVVEEEVEEEVEVEVEQDQVWEDQDQDHKWEVESEEVARFLEGFVPVHMAIKYKQKRLHFLITGPHHFDLHICIILHISRNGRVIRLSLSLLPHHYFTTIEITTGAMVWQSLHKTRHIQELSASMYLERMMENCKI